MKYVFTKPYDEVLKGNPILINNEIVVVKMTKLTH